MKHLTIVVTLFFFILPIKASAMRPVYLPSYPPTAATFEAISKRACSLLNKGDVDATRLVFEHIAIASKKAKYYFALAASYDPAYLSQFELSHPRPSFNQAKEFYTKAAELGHSGAKIRLKHIKTMTPQQFLTFSNQPPLKDLPEFLCSVH